MKRILLSAVMTIGVMLTCADAKLFENGQTEWSIQISEKAPAPVAFAASELAEFLKESSHAEFPIVLSDNTAPVHTILVGETASSAEIKAKFPELDPADNDRIVIHLEDGRLYLAGNRPRAALYAVYAFLERALSIRFLWPGEDGTFVPETAALTLDAAKLELRHRSPFQYRTGTAMCNDPYHKPTHSWLVRTFVNMAPLSEPMMEKTGMIRQMHGGHSIVIEGDKDFKEHPEYFCLIEGKRNKAIGISGCWSNPGFLKLMVERHIKRLQNCEIANILPADSCARCECPDCTKNPDPSSRWYEFYAKIVDELRKTYPDMKFAGIAYQEYRNIPHDPVRNLEYVAYCQYNRCYMHKLNDPTCSVNAKSLAELKEWRKKAPMGTYGYHFDIYKDPTAYLPFWDMLADEVRTCRDLGLKRMMTEMGVVWPKDTPKEDLIPIQHRVALYLYNRLIWDPDADVNELLRGFCQSAYGPAWHEMFDYHRAMADAWNALPIHVVYFFNKPAATARHFITPELTARVNALFAQAEQSLAKASAGKAVERARGEVKVERALFAQWEKYARQANEALTFIPLGKTEKDADPWENAKLYPFVSRGGLKDAGGVKFARTDDALLIRVEAVRDMSVCKKGRTGRDTGDVWTECDELEVFFDPCDGQGYRHLMVNPAGGWYDALGWDVKWNPEWSRQVEFLSDRWILTLRLPFSSMTTKAPREGDQWPIVVDFTRYGEGARQYGFPSPQYHDVSGGAILHFSPAAPDPKREVVWFGKQKDNTTFFAPGLLAEGWSWRSETASDPVEGVKASLRDASAIVMYTYNGNRLPQTFWKEQLVPAVKDGAMIVFNTFGTRIPLDQWFDDPSLAIAIFKSDLDLRDRVIYFGDERFASTPNDMKKYSGYQEYRTFRAADAKAWKVLASIRLADGSLGPILLTRKYGRGTVVVSMPIRMGRSELGTAKFLTNLLEWHKEHS